MRRCLPLCLVLLTIACKSPEEKACENTVRIIESSEHGRSADIGIAELERGCLESLVRLRHQIQPDEEMWFTYLRCLRAATDMSDQAKCLEPLTAPKAQPTGAPPN